MAISREQSDLLRQTVLDILSIPIDKHDSIQSAISDTLERRGQKADMEHLLINYLKDSERLGYIDIVSTGPIRIGIEVDHSVPRQNSIDKLNYFKGDASIIVLKGKTAGSEQKVHEAGKRCRKLKTPFAVVNLTAKIVMLSSPGFTIA